MTRSTRLFSSARAITVDAIELHPRTRIALEEAGHEVFPAASPSAALALAQVERVIDMLLVDVVTPEMDAFELASRLSAGLPGVKILHMSGYTDAREEGHFMRRATSSASGSVAAIVTV